MAARRFRSGGRVMIEVKDGSGVCFSSSITNLQRAKIL
jgi:hypothetical protein